MYRPKISLIAAVSKNNVIGKKGGLPWYIPEDLKRFKQLTMGKPVVMGRKTFDSIVFRLGRPLPGRKNIVVTRDHNYQAPSGVIVVHHITPALHGLPDDEIMVIGGGEIYNQTFDHADNLHITHVDQDIDGDVFFPEIHDSVWRKESEEQGNGFTWVKYSRSPQWTS